MHIALSLLEEDAPTWMPLFAAALPEATIDRHQPDRAADPRARRADYAVAAYPSNTFFTEQPSPKAIFTVSAGVGHVLRMPGIPDGVPIVRVEDAGMSAQMVRYSITAAMRFTQRLPTYRSQQHERVWRQHPPRGPAQVSAGVMGLGVIGAAVARALAAQGFRTRGYSRGAKAIEGVACFAGDALPAFLDGLDIVVNVLPSTAGTRKLLNRETLSGLADGAHVVNIGRGSVLDDEDLLALIESGKIGGATLDVFHEEPLPPSHPFWSLPQITITPHVAGLTIPDETVVQIAAKMRALERGEAVTGVVGRERGY